MTRPILGCFLLGIVWYFAAMLTSLRPARWFASRGLGLAAAFPLHAFVFSFPGLLLFWRFDFMLLLLAALSPIAVWGSIQTDGQYRAQPFLGKRALATVLACGSTVLVIVAIMLFSLVLQTRSDSNTMPSRKTAQCST